MALIQLITVFALLFHVSAGLLEDNQYNANTDYIRIVNGPKNTTACAHGEANISCGFTGSDPNQQVVYWRIIWRDESGSVVHDEIFSIYEISKRPELHLKWEIDNESGKDNSPNSKLAVSLTDSKYNQSSFQCLIQLGNGSNITSSVGTLTVEGPPVIHDVDIFLNDTEVCLHYFTIRWKSTSIDVCGEVKYNITLYFGKLKKVDTSTIYTYYNFTDLQPNNSYNFTVFGTSSAGEGKAATDVFSTSKLTDIHVITNSSKTLVNGSDYNISWTVPSVDHCNSPITGYIVIISFNGHTLSSRIIPSNVTTIMMSEYFPNHPLSTEVEYDVIVVAINRQYKFVPNSISGGSKRSFPEICIFTTAAPTSILLVLLLISLSIHVFCCFKKRRAGGYDELDDKKCKLCSCCC